MPEEQPHAECYAVKENRMNDFLMQELQRVYSPEQQKDLGKEDVKKWVRKTRLKQLLFIFFESVILLGFGIGNLMNNPVRSFSFALGVLCLIVWPFLAVNIHRYLKKLDYGEEDLDQIVLKLGRKDIPAAEKDPDGENAENSGKE
jgi:hypothetical protein